MATLNELVIAMGFDVKSESFQTFSKFVGGLDAIKEGFEKVGKLATNGKELKDFVLGAASRGQDLINLSRNIGMSTDAIQQWQYAADKAGVSAQSVMSDLTSLTTRWRKSQQGVMALAKQIQNASPFMVQAYKQMYGLSDDMITLLRRGPEEIKKYMDEVKKSGGIVSEENLQKGKQLNESLTAFKKNLQGIAETVATSYMPRMQEWSQTAVTWLQNSDNQKTAIKGLTIALGALAGSTLLSGLVTLAVNLKKVGSAILFLKTASLALMASPIGLALTAIAGAGAGVYGLWNWINKENKELADRKKNPYQAHKEYGEPSGGFWSSLFSSPSKYLKGLSPNDMSKFQTQMPAEQSVTNNYNAQITITTAEAAQAFVTAWNEGRNPFINPQDSADAYTPIS